MITGSNAIANLSSCLHTSLTYKIDPLQDSRWDDLLRRHPSSSIFHTKAWLGALQRTYQYEPIAFTTSPPGAELEKGLVLCRVKSWLTGKRLVGVPFSDHCELLAENANEVAALLLASNREALDNGLAYVEVRPKSRAEWSTSWERSTHSYCLHEIDLAPDLDTLFMRCHKNSTQRKIRRSYREGLAYEEGQSRSLLHCFYHLLLMTRRRHRIPPQPLRWFENLAAGFAEGLKIRVAFRGRTPVAAIITIRHKDCLVYKYGASDTNYHNLGPMHLLLWKSIEDAKRQGLHTFDLGRSEFRNSGLVQFKDRWGGRRSLVEYFQYPASAPSSHKTKRWIEKTARSAFAYVPNWVLRSVGELGYKHIG